MPDETPQKPKRPLSTPRNPVYEAIHVRRRVKHYAVSEIELKGIAAENTVSKRACSVGFSLASFGIGVWTTMIIESNPSELAKKLCAIVVPMSFILSLVAFGIWHSTRPEKSEALKAILIDPDETD